MIRSRALLAAATLAVVAAGISACGKSASNNGPDNTNQEMKAPKASATAADRPETTFLDATAQHLCSVQSQVYTDPAAMASAYASQPLYTDLTAAQVEQFQQRVISDPAFADRLTQRVQATCGQAK
ncbi:hypothetical protein [Dactylosporangium sp. NPDC051541]|uniref:hypothetical protein n=1 Tax=Dactylosporangium sp. NPDC051541 TaxID=3363977 RepID=UPI0037A0C859